MSLRERIEQLQQEYDKAATEPGNDVECLYSDICGEIADALEKALEEDTEQRVH